ncbi:LOW QUALITY PROTEIN: phosphate transporter PHO1 homolog 1-like [Apium graveolens]|uniref:LOW QUALITY PROTEIN: phosphate transporter PHO1 homolog 1-like n=1 Tax=Apium graveolens TaxID=4045 RepID=UPI003D790534
MVKFSQQFQGQLVPEWKDAFVDYGRLKKDLKKIHLQNVKNAPSSHQESSLRKTIVSSMRRISSFGNKRRDHGIIHVHKKLESSKSKGDTYETEMLEQFGEDSEAALDFFSCLDLQLNKVNHFFRNKEKEFSERGESLKKQMEILLELKTAIKSQRANEASSNDFKEDDSISGTISCDEESPRYISEQEKEQGNEKDDQFDQNDIDFSGSSKFDETMKFSKMRRVDSNTRTPSDRFLRSQGKNLKIHIPLTNPTRAFSYLLWDDLIKQSSKKGAMEGRKVHINKTKIHHAEKMIRGALIELYKGLGYLKTYRNLNMLAFAKILKKFDKVTNKQVLPIYLKVVENSYFNSSDKVMKLADEVEEIFVKHFAEDDKRKAVKYLKPTRRKESHVVTFFIGLFTGCFIVFFVGYGIMVHIAGMYRPQSDTVYMETVYPVLSMFSLLFLHFFLYGCNIFAWKKTRINYSFIFELSPTKDLKYRDVFLICTMAMTAVVGVLFIHISLIAKGYSYTQVQVIPGLLLLISFLLLVCPINVVYKSTRFRVLRVIRNIVLSPLYKVVMLDFFMADQLCSQVPMLRNLEYVSCYYITRSYKTQDYGYCMRTKNYRDLSYAVSFLPYYWRAMQCARRWFDEGETSHLVNLGKYVSAMLAAGAKVAYEKESTIGWLCLVVIMSSVATVYQLYWDFVKDWGLLQKGSKNPWLRNDLILRRKFIYFLSMGLNLVLRLAWLQTVLHYNFGSIDHRITGLILAALEVIRRGQWNFYRLENEHLNNAGKFRAVKIVPLPFHEVDEED